MELNRHFLVSLMAICMIGLGSCSDKAGSVEGDGRELGHDDSLFVITEQGFEMSIVLPKTLIADEPAHIDYDESLGHLEISIGDNFNLQVIDDVIDVEAEKSEMQNDQFMTFTFHNVGAKQYDYQSTLPDGKVHAHHYMGHHEIGGSPYFIRTSPDGEFTAMQLDRMKKAIASIQKK